MKKILIVFGTRPEAIKLAPVIKELKKDEKFKVIICSTGQHKEMSRQVLDIFKINIDYDLQLMKKNQDLFDVTLNSIDKIRQVLKDVNPDLLLVQGDTTTAFTGSLSAFYNKIKIGHIEAGLRSFNNFHPFPEEINRRIISVLADLHFAPTETAAINLMNEGVHRSKIFITGNTVIDSLIAAKVKIEDAIISKEIEESLSEYLPKNFYEKDFILITLHRREKFGAEFESLLKILKDISFQSNYNFVFPVHLNPNVQIPAKKILNNAPGFKLLPPLDYLSFIYLMNKCHFIITDSGGIQEESYIFKKPVIVMREVTERTEAIDAGFAFLTGSNENKIKSTFKKIDKKISEGFNFFPAKNPFGSGNSAKKIVDIIKKKLD